MTMNPHGSDNYLSPGFAGGASRRSWRWRRLLGALGAMLWLAVAGGCSKPAMNPVRAEVERMMDALNTAGRSISAQESEAARQSDDGKKAVLRKMYIAPILAAGFDPDTSLRAVVAKFVAKDFGSEDEEQIIGVFVAHFAQRAADLERFRLIDAQTATALKGTTP